MKARIARATIAAVALLVTPPLAGSALANHTAAWVNASPGAPASVDFEDVAETGGVVIAVGSDSASGRPVIYRRAGGDWFVDTIAGAPGASAGKLVEVAATSEGGAWAVGSTGASALVVNLAVAKLTSSAPEPWDAKTAPAELNVSSAIALSGSRGLIGDSSDGDVFPVKSDATIDQAIDPGPTTVPGVNGLAIHDPVTGGSIEAFAVTNAPAPPNTTPVFKVRVDDSPPPPSTVTQAAGNAGTTGRTAVSIDALSATKAVAVEGGADPGTAPAVWTVGATGTWSRSTGGFDGNTRLRDVDIFDGGTETVELIAGRQGAAGAIWRRDDGGDWTPQVLPEQSSAAAITGIVAIGERDVWAVGEDGRVLHFQPQTDPPAPAQPPPVPPETTIVSGPLGATNDSTPTFSFSSDKAGSTFECSVDSGEFSSCFSPHTLAALSEGSHTFAVRAVHADGADASPAVRSFSYVRPPGSGTPDPGVDVDDRGGDEDCKGAPKKLAKNVNVKASRKRIRISFKLKQRAKVKAIAERGDDVVGKTRKKVMRRGKQQLSFKVKKPPTTVRLVVRPAKSC